MPRVHRIVTAAAAAVTLAAAQPARAQDRDIVETAVAAGSFTTLAKALTAAGLVETLKGAGPFTVFAPTDEAFAKLPAGALDKLLADRAQLRRVLLYHVVPGRVPAAEVVKLTSAKTAAGPSAKVMMHGAAPMIDGANVVKTDVAASNGIIHVIDAVLMPPAGGGAAVRKDGR
jgi:uncharacterized surface protein with fasciclin (FAS1) repeats